MGKISDASYFIVSRLSKFVTLLRRRRYVVGLLAAGIFVAAAYAITEFRRDEAQTFFDDPIKHFKYGSTGGDRLAGLPIGLFKALPVLCRDYLPSDGWQSLGFVFEEGMDRPVGTSERYSLGFDRVALNCAACHVGTYRKTPEGRRVVVPGMPANRLDLERFTRFFTDCALDERFNPWQVMQAIDATDVHYSPIQRFLLEYFVVPAVREVLIFARYRFRFLDHEVAAGPGRFDTFGPEKALLNWPFDALPPGESIGIVDFPSLWLQGPRATAHMQLHWDGNNDDVEERNRSAAFGTGAVPTTLDRTSMDFIADWLKSPVNKPPKYPFPIDAVAAERGKVLYEAHCASCHGVDGGDFSGNQVGRVDPIGHIRTDPCRLDNYTHDLAVEQGNLYAGFPDRFRHFRKTEGYASMPLDGIWLRAPYLHNGSVPTVRDLLEPPGNRPKVFYRGYDVVDRDRLGFISTVESEGSVQYFRYETQCVTNPGACAESSAAENRYEENVCVPGRWAGNSNRGHDGADYGTDLKPEEKDAIVEFLKTF
jgi:Cytochrome c